MVLDGAEPQQSDFDEQIAKTEDYDQFNLNDLGGEDTETYAGEPYLGELSENEFDDGRKQISAIFTLANHKAKDRINGRVKAKSLDDEVTFWRKSLGFELIKSIKELNGEKVDPMTNRFKISFKELREYINGLKHITVEVVSYSATIDDNLTLWNTLKVISEE